MFAVLREGAVMGVYDSREMAEANALPGDSIEPATFGNSDPGRLRLQVKWKLEKFEGDTENLVEVLEGEF